MADFETTPPPLPAVPAKRKRVRTKTYVLALYLTCGVALIPVGAVISVFWLRHKVTIDTHSPFLRAELAGIPAGETNTPAAAPLFPPPPPAPVQSLQPTLGAARLPVPVVDPAQKIADLDQQAYLSTQQGAYDQARAALLAAENIDPRSVRTLREEAELAEAQKDWTGAIPYWQRIVDLGDAAGDTGPVARQRIALLRQKLAGVPPSGEAAKSWVLRAGEGERSGDAALTTLRIPILPANDTEIDPGKVGIKLFFYDQLKTGVVVPTNAQLEVAFENPRPTWENGQTEVLRAVYRRLTGDVSQKYYGYVFRLYYKGALQVERSDPADLLKLFPASP